MLTSRLVVDSMVVVLSTLVASVGWRHAIVSSSSWGSCGDCAIPMPLAGVLCFFTVILAKLRNHEKSEIIGELNASIKFSALKKTTI